MNMWNEPTREQLQRLPKLYQTENVPLEEKLIHLHFFLGGCDWFVAEYGREDRLFWGYAILNDDLANAEWGYISYDELRSVRTRQGFEVDRDVYWRPTRASEVARIKEGMQW